VTGPHTSQVGNLQTPNWLNQLVKGLQARTNLRTKVGGSGSYWSASRSNWLSQWSEVLQTGTSPVPVG
jgi:hypothetical protein